MKAAVWFGPRDIRCEDVPAPALGAPHEMLVQVEATSICGSDLHLWRGALAPIMVPGRSRTGHELIGRVVATGSGVTRFRAGDRVSMAYSCSCGACAMCALGMTAHCETTGKAVYGFGVPFGDLNGTHAEFLVLPHAQAHALRVPDGVSDAAALTLSCNLPAALVADRLATVSAGESVALVGCGPTGLLALDLVRRHAPGPLVALDPLPHRRAQAAARGAVAIDAVAADHVAQALAHTAGRGYDKVIEVVGAPAALQTALALARPGATVAAIGVFCDPRFELPLADVFLRDLTVHMHGFANVQPFMAECLRLLETGAIDPGPLFSHEFRLDDIASAFRTFDEARDGALKMLIRP